MAPQKPPYPEELRAIAEPYAAEIRDVVARIGWAVVAVEGTEPFAYTVGVTRLIGHPELIVTGLPDNQARGVLNATVAYLRGEATILRPGHVVDELVDDRDAVVVAVARTRLPELAFACDFYGGLKFDALQLVWSDEVGRYPWDRGASRSFRRKQPILKEERTIWRRLVGR